MQLLVMMTLLAACRINNAGSNAYKYKTLAESADADLINIVETNVLGVMLGCREVRVSPTKWLPPAAVAVTEDVLMDC